MTLLCTINYVLREEASSVVLLIYKKEKTLLFWNTKFLTSTVLDQRVTKKARLFVFNIKFYKSYGTREMEKRQVLKDVRKTEK